MSLFSSFSERRGARFQDDLIKRHYDEVENIYRQMRGWKHDFRNQMQVIRGMLETADRQELIKYIDRLDYDLASVDTVLKTGSVTVDAILNSKISLALSKAIRVTADAAVPSEIKTEGFDLCVIIGNLLDNAIEACMKLEDETERFIRVYIDKMGEQLYISVTNSYGGHLRRSGRAYLTTKAGFHGLGILRVDKIAAKYGGYVNRQSEPGVFATEVLLPL